MFQHFMNDILREYLDLIAVGILDDVIIFLQHKSTKAMEDEGSA